MNRIGHNLICTGANEEIVRSFVQSAVEFVVIGGLAVSWYCDSRTADDMDLLVNPTLENSAKVFRALNSLGLSGFEPHSFSKLSVQAQLKQRHYADILTPEHGTRAFDVIASDAVSGQLFGFPVRIASIACLIQLKEAAAAKADHEREKHVHDINLLRGHAA